MHFLVNALKHLLEGEEVAQLIPAKDCCQRKERVWNRGGRVVDATWSNRRAIERSC